MSKRVLSMVLAVLLLASVWTPAFAEEGPEEPVTTEEAAPAETTDEAPAEPEDTDEPEAAPAEEPAEAAPTEEPVEEPAEPTEEPAEEPAETADEAPAEAEAAQEPEAAPAEEPAEEALPEQILLDGTMPIDESTPVLNIIGASSKVAFDYYDHESETRKPLKNGDRFLRSLQSVGVKLEDGYAIRGDVYYIETYETILCDEHTVDEYGNFVNDQPDGKCTIYVYQPKKATIKLSDPDGVFDIYKVEPSGIIIAPFKNGDSVPEGTTLYFVYKNAANKGTYQVKANGMTLKEEELPSHPVDKYGFTDPKLDGAFCWSVQLPTAVEKGWKSSYSFTAEPSSTLAAPAAVAENAANGVKISWDAVPDAVKYQVYYRTSTKNSWKKLGDAQTGLEYTYTGAASNKTYYFAVRCVTAGGAAVSPYSASMKIKYIAAPKAPTAALADSGIKISWKKVSGASYYQVYEIKGGTQVKLGSPTKSTSYTWKAATPNEAHVFAVQCTNKAGTTANSVIGASSAPITIVGAPQNVKAENTTGGVKISWQAVDGAVKYRVYYATKKSGSLKKVADVAAGTTDYTWAKAKKGSTYYYAVRCLTADGSAASPYSARVALKYLAAPAKPTAAIASTGIKVSWKKVTGASKYQLYYKEGTGDWQKLGGLTKSTSYTWKDYASQKAYEFAVEGVSGSYVSAKSAASASFTAVEAPKNVKTESTVGGVKISWDAVAGAVKYRVYYATKKSGSLKKVADVAAGTTDYTWAKAKKGSTYYYAVRCITDSGSAASPYSSPRVARKYVAAPTVKAAAVSTGIKLSWGKSAGASKYQVYYKEGAGEWTKLTLTKSTSYTWKDAKAGVAYTFTAEATDSKGSALSARKEEDAATLTIAAKPELSFEKTEGGLKISWDKDGVAAKYQVYYGTKKGSLKKLGSAVTGSEYTWASAKAGKSYYFSVRPLTEGGKLAGPYDTKGVKYTVPKA